MNLSSWRRVTAKEHGLSSSECEFFPDIRPGVGLLGHMEKLYVASKGEGKVGRDRLGLGLADAKYYI